MPVWCLDLACAEPVYTAMSSFVCTSDVLRIASGSVRGLNVKASCEPEAAYTQLLVDPWMPMQTAFTAASPPS